MFLINIEPSEPGVDDWLWVVVGDIPPAYLVTDNAPDPISALGAYNEVMQDWVDAVNQGQPVENLIPVNAPPTKEYATMLQSRLTFLKEQLLSDSTRRSG